MNSRIALDTNCFRRLLGELTNASAVEPDDETVALVRIYLYVATPFVVPTVSAEIDERGDSSEVKWRNYHFAELTALDDFFRGCAKGKSETYLGFYSDPRDCRIVAEAECAKIDVVLTTKLDLITRLKDSVQSVAIVKPSEYWQTAQVPKGTAPRTLPASGSPLAAVNWWRW